MRVCASRGGKKGGGGLLEPPINIAFLCLMDV